MKSLIITLLMAGSISITSPALAAEKAVEVSKVELDKLDARKIKKPDGIHRIESKEEYERMGGKKVPVDFSKHDLVIVHGTLRCATGKVEATAEKQSVIFKVRMKRCTHMTEQLCISFYVGYFSVSKHAVLVDGTKKRRRR